LNRDQRFRKPLLYPFELWGRTDALDLNKTQYLQAFCLSGTILVRYAGPRKRLATKRHKRRKEEKFLFVSFGLFVAVTFFMTLLDVILRSIA
jgi:hypothetical protein